MAISVASIQYELGDRILQSLTDLGGLYTKGRRWAHWVAIENNTVVGAMLTYATKRCGFKQIATGQPSGHIVWLLFKPGHPDIGTQLLKKVRHWLGARAFELANCLGWCAGLPSS